MPPLPITLVTAGDMASSSRRRYHRFYRPIIMSNGIERVAYIAYTIDDGSPSGSSPDSQNFPGSSLLPNRPRPKADSSTIAATSTTSSRKKRKATAFNVDFASNDFITLKPKTNTIIDRCFPSPSTASPTGTASAQNAGGSKKKGPTLEEATAAISANRWSRATDLGNNRSNIPSPREVARSKIKEQERAKARVEAAAQKRSKKGRRRGSNGTITRNQSPQEKEEVNPTTAVNATMEASSSTPKVDPSPSNTSVNPFPPRVGLKRTRSVGVPSISTNLANSLGAAGAPAVSSPLKAVTGPNTPEEGDQARKRSRLSDPTDAKSPRLDADTPRKATSLSPPSTATPLPLDPAPNTVPAATLPLKLEATEMRRAASASTIDAPATRGSRRSSFGIEALAARERSKREVTMPGRLKDYDVRATTPA